jgi:hypothetical protein
MTQNDNVPLNGKQIEQLADGLLGAFTNFNDLARLVLVALDEPLNRIVNQQASLRDQVWQLVENANAKGKVRDLIQASVAKVPGNVQLRAAAEAVFGKGVLDDPPPQLPAGSPPSRPPSTENSMASGDATNPRPTAPVPSIFISYRRDDSIDAANRIYDRLVAHFGRGSVFMDEESIPVGIDFRKNLQAAVSRCDVLLAVIGQGWLKARGRKGPSAGQRRLDNPDDFVRIEIQTALERGIPVVPVLVGKATMPAEKDLPDALKELAFRHFAEVRPGKDFHDHVDRLIRGIEARPTSPPV